MGIFDRFTTPAAPAPASTPTEGTPSAPGTPAVQPGTPATIPAHGAAPITNTPATPATLPPATLPGANPPATPPATIDPATGLPVEQAAVDPLLAFQDMWKQPKPVEGAPTEYKHTPMKVEDVAKALEAANFNYGLTPEIMQTIAGGGDQAVTAMQALVTSATKQAIQTSTMAADNMIAQNVQAAIKAQLADIPNLIKQQTVANGFVELHPVAQNPAIAPVVQGIQQQLLQQNPNATPSDINKQTNDFIQAMSQGFAPKDPNAGTPDPANVSVDWSVFLNPTIQ